MGAETWTLAKTVGVKEEDERGHNIWRTEEESWEFPAFEDARDAFRRLAYECAMTEGDVFDGDGNIRNLQEWFDTLVEGIEESKCDPRPNTMLGSQILRGAPEISFMAGDFESAKAMPAALRSWLLDMGAYDANPLPDFKWTDWVIGVVSKPDSLALGAISDEDRIEVFDAQVYTNAFDMGDPDGDYEFSVRTGFDPYDPDAGALRIRLAKGSFSGGHFDWPEERDSWPAFCDEPAPCVLGEFDSNDGITVHVRPGRDGEDRLDERLVEGYEEFLDNIVGIVEDAGLVADVKERRCDDDGEWANFRVYCYKADEGCWSKMGIWVHYQLHPTKHASPPEHLNVKPRKRDDPPISVGPSWNWRLAGHHEEYADALPDVRRFVESHAEHVGMRNRPDADEQPKDVIFIDFVVNFDGKQREGD